MIIGLSVKIKFYYQDLLSFPKHCWQLNNTKKELEFENGSSYGVEILLTEKKIKWFIYHIKNNKRFNHNRRFATQCIRSWAICIIEKIINGYYGQSQMERA